MGVNLHIRLETRRPGEKWCIASEAVDYSAHSRSIESMLIGMSGQRDRGAGASESLGFTFNIPSDSPYYAISGDEYVPFSWAPWPLVMDRLEWLAAEVSREDWGHSLLDWVREVDAWRLAQGFDATQVRAICGHW